MSQYKLSLEQTRLTLERRGRCFRNAIVAAAVIMMAAVFATIAMGRSWLFAGLGALVVDCGLFAFADSRVLRSWRAELLAPWQRCDLDLWAFRAAVSAVPTFPRATLEAMLSTLPIAGSLVEEQRVTAVTRRGVAAAREALDRDNSDWILARTMASAVVAGALTWASWARSWIPLWGFLSLGLMPIARGLIVGSHSRQLGATLTTLRKQPEFSDVDYARLSSETQ